MKILESFDTKLDEKELLTAINRYGKGNAILTKKHRIFLIAPLFLLLLTVGAFGMLVWFSYAQYYASHPIVFWIVCSSQLAVTLVWIVHSLQTVSFMIKQHYPLWQSLQPYFGSVKEKSLKDGKYEIYLKHSFISLILQTVLMVLDVVLAVVFKVNDFNGWLMVSGGVVLNVIFISVIWRTIAKIIDFEMYFNIFTPEQFTIYRQKGILRTESVSISTSSIKMIKEIKNWRGSLRGYGKLSIHPEGGANDAPPVNIAYVAKPKMLMKKLNDFIDQSKKMIAPPIIPKL